MKALSLTRYFKKSFSSLINTKTLAKRARLTISEVIFSNYVYLNVHIIVMIAEGRLLDVVTVLTSVENKKFEVTKLKGSQKIMK